MWSKWSWSRSNLCLSSPTCLSTYARPASQHPPFCGAIACRNQPNSTGATLLWAAWTTQRRCRRPRADSFAKAVRVGCRMCQVSCCRLLLGGLEVDAVVRILMKQWTILSHCTELTLNLRLQVLSR
ncbi:hypothetical protein IWZ03DRAFT_373247 [Phyllosticta citriasiana]|uniref:Secreted protein n=1 Tax=Phyllosticta citriasiana TaxID=595635 RepID=A0ABR1KSU1_9PEZI